MLKNSHIGGNNLTVQVSEQLTYNVEELDLYSNPLSVFFQFINWASERTALNGVTDKPTTGYEVAAFTTWTVKMTIKNNPYLNKLVNPY